MKRKEFLSIITFVFANFGLQQKQEVCKIKTNTVCMGCKYRLERNIAFEKGVKDVSLDIEKKTFTIIYKPTKTTPEILKKALIAMGYDADELKANTNQRKELKACCFDSNVSH